MSNRSSAKLIALTRLASDQLQQLFIT